MLLGLQAGRHLSVQSNTGQGEVTIGRMVLKLCLGLVFRPHTSAGPLRPNQGLSPINHIIFQILLELTKSRPTKPPARGFTRARILSLGTTGLGAVSFFIVGGCPLL